jgi:hypothetical protein
VAADAAAPAADAAFADWDQLAPRLRDGAAAASRVAGAPPGKATERAPAAEDRDGPAEPLWQLAFLLLAGGLVAADRAKVRASRHC